MEMSFVTIKARIEDARSEEDRRASARFTVDLDARVRELGDEGADAKVLNISEKGFMAATGPMRWSAGSPATRSAPSSPSRFRSTN